MYLPESLQEQSFVTWNHTVKGLVQVWEMACLLGLEQRLEQRLRCDQDATLARKLGELGNDPLRMANTLRHCLKNLLANEERSAPCVVLPRCGERLPLQAADTKTEALPEGSEETSQDDSSHLVSPTAL